MIEGTQEDMIEHMMVACAYRMKRCEACKDEFPACIFQDHLEQCQKAVELACRDDPYFN